MRTDCGEDSQKDVPLRNMFRSSAPPSARHLAACCDSNFAGTLLLRQVEEKMRRAVLTLHRLDELFKLYEFRRTFYYISFSDIESKASRLKFLLDHSNTRPYPRGASVGHQ